jgi:phosphatidylglycerol:prolipoprotein diacylglycerol transferase
VVLAAISYPPIPVWDIGPIQFSLHGLFAAVGFILGGWLATRKLRERGYDTVAYQSVLSWALVGSLIGARYLTTPAALLGGVPLGVALNPIRGNFSIMGGFVGGILAGWWRMRKVGLAPLPTFDASAYGLALGTVVGRVGDLAIVEHLGSATSVPWGFGVRPGYDLAPVHDLLECGAGTPLVDGFCPVPVDVAVGVAGQAGIYHHVAAYDLIGAAVLLGLLGVFAARLQLRYGQLFAIWVAWYGFQRFLLDFMRFGSGDPTIGALTWNQVAGLAGGLVGVGLFLWYRRNPIVDLEHDRELASSR